MGKPDYSQETYDGNQWTIIVQSEFPRRILFGKMTVRS
jgi:hypothetical protein